MHRLNEPPPVTLAEPVTEIMHGASVTDPYRWLEDPQAPATRNWLEEQSRFARAYFDSLPQRSLIRESIRSLLEVETYDSILQRHSRYFFRKRLPSQEQPCICMREGPDGRDQVLVDPKQRGVGDHTSVRPLSVSPDGHLLLYSIKNGGERTSQYELLDIETRRPLPDALPRGYLRGFVFRRDSKAFFYVHESQDSNQTKHRSAYLHVLGTPFSDDTTIFSAGHGQETRLDLVCGPHDIGFLVFRISEKIVTDFYIRRIDDCEPPRRVLSNLSCMFGPALLADRILAITDRNAPNLKIVQIRPRTDGEADFLTLIPEAEVRIQSWAVADQRIYVTYVRNLRTEIQIFSLTGQRVGQLKGGKTESLRLLSGSVTNDEVFVERESFTQPAEISRFIPATGQRLVWANRECSTLSASYGCKRIAFNSRDGTTIPITLVGLSECLETGQRPTIMTSYGGFGIPMTARFSVLVTFLIEHGCLFALPHIRGGSEFGDSWHRAAQRHKRQSAFDDFIGAAEWLIKTGRTPANKLAIFGGSNSGLLVGGAMTQRPDLFRAVICIGPLLDMLRFHLFDQARVWTEEFGTAEDASDFAVLRAYSPYHNVRGGTAYPATLMISGSADQTCNSLHARKMTAMLQAANASEHPVLLDYSAHRGHSPVLPLTERIGSLTDRLAFLCNELELDV